MLAADATGAVEDDEGVDGQEEVGSEEEVAVVVEVEVEVDGTGEEAAALEEMVKSSESA